MSKTSMTRAEREAFLADLHVGVISIPQTGRGPLTVPIWYGYVPGGDVLIVTDRDSRKGRSLAPGVRVSLCVQTETAPYQYVSVEGPIISIRPSDVEREIRPMAHRYLGTTLGDAYVAATSSDRSAGDSIVVRIQPEHWLSVDYRKAYDG